MGRNYMGRKKKVQRQSRPFEKPPGEPAEWLSEEQPLLCEAVRMEPETDPWEREGKIVRADSTTEKRRRKMGELSLNVEHFIDDESGAIAV